MRERKGGIEGGSKISGFCEIAAKENPSGVDWPNLAPSPPEEKLIHSLHSKDVSYRCTQTSFDAYKAAGYNIVRPLNMLATVPLASTCTGHVITMPY